MKKHTLILAFFLSTSLIFSQTKVDRLVQIGIQYHDNGEYNKAIENYRSALEIDPNSPLAHYEIAMTYMYAQNYKMAIKHSNQVIKINEEYKLPAYIIKGSCLDYLGKTDESIKIFKKGIEDYGDHYLLYYNLGYNYYNLKEYDKAEEALTNAIRLNSEHASSHLLLAYLMIEKNQRIQALLCLHYFLFAEPNSDRSFEAFNLLKEQQNAYFEVGKDSANQININLNPNRLETEFGSAELMLSMIAASNSLEKNKDKTEDEIFIDNTKSFFKILGEMQNEENTGIWWDFYIPLFYNIAKSDHLITYCNFISQSSNFDAQEWLINNADKSEDFANWLEKQE